MGPRPRPIAGAAGLLAVAVGLVLLLRPLSHWLLPFTADGALEPATARFLDALWVLVLGAGILALLASVQPALGAAFAGMLGGPPQAGGKQRRSLVALVALLTLVARLVVAQKSDIGLGDDGARVAWLLHWLQHPEPVPRELWGPGHLYLHALFWLVFRDAVRAGIVLSALSSAATVFLLGRTVERHWGRAAGTLAALFVAVLPVTNAHAATPDVNPVFAFLCVAAVCCAQRSAQGSFLWLVLGWVCVFFAAWSRFETFLLVPAFAAPLWRRWRRALVFALACLLPSVLWAAAVQQAHGDFMRLFHTLKVDPTLSRPLGSRVFDFLWAGWLAVPLSMALLGAVGGARALRWRRGAEFLPLLLLHLGSLLLATWSTGTGNQPRYFILVGSLAAAYAGAALGGALQRSPPSGLLLAALALVLVPWTGALFPHEGELWIRHIPRLRQVTDCVAASRATEALQAAPVVWIADEAGYFFLCRERLPVERYHSMPRAESDASAIAAALRGEPVTLVVLRDNAESERRWQALAAALGETWQVEERGQRCADYRLLELRAPPAPRSRPPSSTGTGAPR